MEGALHLRVVCNNQIKFMQITVLYTWCLILISWLLSNRECPIQKKTAVTRWVK